MIRLFLATMIFSSVALADRGGWVASGGELFRYGKNPWFLKNTTTVEYCVEIDRGTVSASESDVYAAVSDAIDYWKREFDPQQAMLSKPGFVRVGTQAFTRVSPCRADLALKFKIGAGTLDPDELQFLNEPSKYVGVSVRKEYDPVTLAGKGIVFISSDRGPHAYNQRPNSGHLYPEAWKEKKLLTYALIHEMGHVFGIPHTGVGLMSEVFLEQLLHKKFVQFYLDKQLDTFLSPVMNFDVCMLSGSFNTAFFQIPNDTACLRFEGVMTAGVFEWKLSTLKGPKDTPVPAGTLKASMMMQFAVSAKPALIVQLPPEQTVFSLANRNMNSFLIGPMFSDSTAQGVFQTPASSRPNAVQVDLRPDSILMTAVVAGKLTPVLVYSPPSLLNTIFPIGP